MKITAGKVVPSIVAATSLIETKVGYEVAEQIADVIVALEGERMKIEILQKNVLGGKDRVESSDPDYDDIVRSTSRTSSRLTPAYSETPAQRCFRVVWHP